MSEQYVVFLERRHAGDPFAPRRCVTVEPIARRRPERAKSYLVLQILGADQAATEFLTREQFEELVTNARRVMQWDQ